MDLTAQRFPSAFAVSTPIETSAPESAGICVPSKPDIDIILRHALFLLRADFFVALSHSLGAVPAKSPLSKTKPSRLDVGQTKIVVLQWPIGYRKLKHVAIPECFTVEKQHYAKRCFASADR